MKSGTSRERESAEPTAAGIGMSLPVAEVRSGHPVVKGPALQVSSEWTGRDLLDAWKVRWGIGRMSSTVPPGLHALNGPDEDSPVMVTANYKLSFDTLRRSLSGRRAWILVLDTAGVNVWCAAGKGTFGTEELIRRVEDAHLGEVVRHRRLIVPQLGGPGVAGHVVKKATGFRVVFGPVRASDLPAFLDAGLKADRAMRQVTFTFSERMVLVPMELIPALKWSLPVFLLLLAVGGISPDGFSLSAAATDGRGLLIAYAGALAAGAVLTPALLPWLPGRSFSFKGFIAGLAWAILIGFGGAALPLELRYSLWDKAALLLGLPAVSAYLAMTFTGSAVSTSLSGVRKEMRYALPLQIAGAAAAVLLLCAGRFLGGVTL